MLTAGTASAFLPSPPPAVIMAAMPRRKRPEPIYAEHFLEHFRRRAGISQSKLGEIAGTGQQRVSDLESRQVQMTLDAAQTYARALGVSPQEIIFGPEMPTAEEQALLSHLRDLAPAKRLAVLEITGAMDRAFTEAASATAPESLQRAAQLAGRNIGNFDATRWQEIDDYVVRELAAIPEIGATTALQRSDMVAGLYLLSADDAAAGRPPDFAQFRLFILSQAGSFRAMTRRRPQA